MLRSDLRTSHLPPVALAALATAVLAGCGGSSAAPTSSAPATPGSSSTAASSAPASSGAPSPTTSSSSSGAVNPNERETLPPGDIPDTIAYVPYTSRALGLTVSIPEGWSRTVTTGAISFTDKLNRVRVFTAPAPRTPTPVLVRRAELPGIGRSVKSFALESITTVARSSGPAVRIAYQGDSAPDPVTGKVGTLAFERYDFVHRGREVVILVSSPKGSDNVDPWRKITDSLRFSR